MRPTLSKSHGLQAVRSFGAARPQPRAAVPHSTSATLDIPMGIGTSRAGGGATLHAALPVTDPTAAVIRKTI